MRAATVDNLRIGAPWAPVLDHSCDRGRRSGGGPLALTLDYSTEVSRYVHVTAEVSWSTAGRGRSQAVVDVPTVLHLGGSCVSVRARAEGTDGQEPVSVSAQLVSSTHAAPTRPTLTERVAAQQLSTIAAVPHWARRLRVLSAQPFVPLASFVDLFADSTGFNRLARARLHEQIDIVQPFRWRRFINAGADLILVWTLGL